MNQNYIKSSSIGQTRLATKAAPKQTATQKMLRSILFGIVFILSCALVPTAVTGQVVLNNKSAEVGDNYKAGFNGGFGSAEKAAQAFTTGTALTCQSISVDLVMATGDDMPAANFTVQICGETGGQPDEGNILATLSGNSNPAAAGTYTYTGTVTWAAGQNLFIVCSANTLAGAYLWNYTLDAPITTSNAYTAPFSLQTNSVGNWTNGSDQRFLFSLTVSTAPSCTAPTAYNLTGGGAYCAGGTGVEVGLANSESGVSYQLKNSTGNVGSPVSGTGAAISFGNQTVAGIYTVVATKATCNCTATMTGSVTVTVTPTVTPSVSIAANPTGSITSGTSVTFTATPTNGGTTPAYQWKKNGNNVGTNSATYTDAALANGDKIKVEMTSNADCASPTLATSNEITMAVTTPCVNPTAYNVTGGGAYCAGGTGVAVGLASSQTGVSYQLKKDNVNTGSAIAGTGAAISFGNQTAAGTYTVVATRTVGNCTANMNSSATVTITPLPVAYNVTGGGVYCAGGTGVTVGLSNSETGVSYQLKKDNVNVGTAVSGTGMAISFGNQTAAGTYTVEAIKTLPIPARIGVTNGALAPPPSGGSCNVTMTGSVTITITPLPTAYNVTGGGAYCAGGTGVAIGLSNSETGVTYQLKKDNVNDGAAVAGTGMAISFGNKTAAGLYTVVATRTTGGCTATMNGSVTVSTVAPPTASISGTTTVCKDAPAPNITLTGAVGTAPYTFTYKINGGADLTVTSSGNTATVSVPTGTAGSFVYTLVSVKDASSTQCSQTQSGTATVLVNTKPIATLTVNGQTLTEGSILTLCDNDANPNNPLQANITTACVAGPVLWRVQIGAGAWSAWSETAPNAQPSDNTPYRYQVACNAACPSTISDPIVLTLNYRAAIPQNVSLTADGITVLAGQSATVCDLVGNTLIFNGTCGSDQILTYSVDGSDFFTSVPTQIVDNNFHNYRLRCIRSNGTASCVETESVLLTLKITPVPLTPTATLTPTSNCGTSVTMTGNSTCGVFATVWFDATSNKELASLPPTTPSVSSAYYARCRNTDGCLGAASNTVTFTAVSTQAPTVVASAELVCTGTEVTLTANCPAGTSVGWNDGSNQNPLKVTMTSPIRLTYTARCSTVSCQGPISSPKTVVWKAFDLTPINIGRSQSGIKVVNDKSAWASQFITPDAGPTLENSTQNNPTIYYAENINKTAPRYWTIHADACALGTGGSLTFDMLATPESGPVRSFNTHENNAPYFMYANRDGYTELYAQNHPAYGFYLDNGAGGNVYDEGLPKGLYKLGVRYWDQKGWGSIFPSTRKPQGNVLAYQEYWFRIQSKDGIGVGAARVASDLDSYGMTKGAFAQVMPNPVSNVLRLKVLESKNKKVNVSLIDASGRPLLQRAFVPETNTHQEEFNVSELANGMYFLKVNTGEKQATLKVVKVE